jgi:hypothetical protein
VAIVAVAAIAVAVWAVARDGGSTDSTATPEGVVHVHGLGIDPADGTLYVATHYGTFRVPEDGNAKRIGPVQDTMGFTVVGPGHFLGSGHPSAEGGEPGQPANLGLIESTDAGATWKELSLSGEADFHALAYAHNQVYGWASTSGEFMVSTDKRNWESRSTLQIFGLAVDPASPDRVIATTPDGVQASSDGGRSWQPLTGAPELVLVAWDPNSGLWGIDPGGATYHATALDQQWQPTGTLPGPPQALLADGDTLYAAAEDDSATGIYQSNDNGQTWQVRYRDSQ